MIADTSFVVALMDQADARHGQARHLHTATPRTLVTTPLALAEMDYLLTRQGGRRAATALRAQLDGGRLRVEWWPAAVRTMTEVASRYASLGIGLTDASLVALAAHRGTATIATLDERHFRRLQPLTGEPAFTLLPADAV